MESQNKEQIDILFKDINKLFAQILNNLASGQNTNDENENLTEEILDKYQLINQNLTDAKNQMIFLFDNPNQKKAKGDIILGPKTVQKLSKSIEKDVQDLTKETEYQRSTLNLHKKRLDNLITQLQKELKQNDKNY